MRKFSRLPGLGPRSARRIVLHILKRPEDVLDPLKNSLEEVKNSVNFCQVCGYLDDQDPCSICQDPQRSSEVLCVVSDIGDVWAFERSGFFKGRYHVLGGVLSVLGGIKPESLSLDALASRAQHVQEVVLALSATVAGQTTVFYVTEFLKSALPNLKITTLARGIPLGGEVDYLDDGTLMTAFSERHGLPDDAQKNAL